MRYEETFVTIGPAARGESALLDAIAVAGAVALGAWVRVPLPFSPVPVTLQTLPVLLAGFAVGRARATAGLALYLALGLAGVPLFATAWGVTLGYLLAFVAVHSVVTRFRDPALGIVVGSVVIYAMGAAWLCLSLHYTPSEALMLGVVPFLLGDALKAVAAYRLVNRVHRQQGFG